MYIPPMTLGEMLDSYLALTAEDQAHVRKLLRRLVEKQKALV
jgi:hypothetical protein